MRTRRLCCRCQLLFGEIQEVFACSIGLSKDRRWHESNQQLRDQCPHFGVGIVE